MKKNLQTFKNIPVVILCGGKGLRMREDGELRPKPMVEIGGRPILWHIMKTYAEQGFRRFILPLGYGGEAIRNYFHPTPDGGREWTVTLVETGGETLKGGRIKRVEAYLDTEHFHVTYGDGVADVDLQKLHTFHLRHGRLATLTAVHPPSRFGELVLKGSRVQRFVEKPQMSAGRINGGFFVFRREFLSHLTTETDCDLEFGALQRIAHENEMRAFLHPSFWQCMDTPRERDFLNRLWAQQAPWKIWKDEAPRDEHAALLEA